MNLLLPPKQVTRRRRSINIQIDSRSEVMNAFAIFCRRIKILYNPYWRVIRGNNCIAKLDGHEDFYYQPMPFCNNLFNPFLIVKDINNENRFLILISYMIEIHVFAIFGIIVYKDSVSSEYVCQNVHILDKILLVSDFKEDFPNKANVFFSNQSIMVSLRNNNKDSYTINMIVVNYEDRFVCVSSICDSNLFNFNSKSRCNLISDRWVKFESNPNSDGNIGITLINLLSFEFKDEGVYFDIATFPDLHKFYEYFDANTDEVLKENDKLFCDLLYPNTICIKCEGILSSVNYVFGAVNETGGNNVCTSCKIRYSYTEGGWVCCRYLKSNSIVALCNNKVDVNSECNNNHIVRYDFTKIHKGATSKYPNFEKYDFCIECIE